MTSNATQVIFIINNTLAIGGVERKIANIAQYLSKNIEVKNLIVYLILDEKRPLDSEEGIFYDIVHDSNVRILYKPQIKLGNFELFAPVYLLWKTLILRPVVILSFLRRSSIISVFLKCIFWWRRIRVVISDDNITSVSLATDIQNHYKRRIFFNLIRMFYPKASVVAAVSDTIKRDLIENFSVPQEKIAVNKNWVLKYPLRKNAQEHFDLIYVGRVHQVKNLALLVEIIHEVRKVIPSVCCCIVGGGDDIDNISRLTEQYRLDSTISLVGFQKDVSKYFSASRVFCLTSYSEGLPLAALEAMAFGLPVVTTSYAGAEELVQDGTTGYICANKKEYFSRVIELLSDERLRLRMGKEAQSYVRSHHGPKNLKAFVEILLGELKPGE